MIVFPVIKGAALVVKLQLRVSPELTFFPSSFPLIPVTLTVYVVESSSREYPEESVYGRIITLFPFTLMRLFLTFISETFPEPIPV